MTGAMTGDESLAAFAAKLDSCTDFSARWNQLVGFLGAYGADQINYGIFETFSFRRDEAPVNFISTMNPEWLSYYAEKRFDLGDPHVITVREGRLKPYRWSEERATKLTDEMQRDVAAQTADAGLRAQIHMIAPDPLGIAGPLGGITIGSSMDARDYFGSIDGREDMLVSAAHLFHQQAIGDVYRQQVGATSLSTRERDCMTYAALGLRTTRIAERLALSEVTVELHLRNARRKLKAVTTSQAVARAIVLGDVTI